MNEKEESVEKRFKMRVIGTDSIDSTNLTKEIKLFDNVFDNSDVAQFENECVRKENKNIQDASSSNQITVNNHVIFISISKFSNT